MTAMQTDLFAGLVGIGLSPGCGRRRIRMATRCDVCMSGWKAPTGRRASALAGSARAAVIIASNRGVGQARGSFGVR
jgi:hypothetical protein